MSVFYYLFTIYIIFKKKYTHIKIKIKIKIKRSRATCARAASGACVRVHFLLPHTVEFRFFYTDGTRYRVRGIHYFDGEK